MPSLSAHLVGSFMTAQPSGSFGQSLNIVQSGNQSYSSSAHGNNSLFFGGGSHFVDDAERNAQISNQLKKGLGPEFISQRPGPGGGPKLTYVEGWKLINVANEVFGFNGWSSQIISLQIDYCDHAEGRFNVGASAVVRVTLRDGSYHEDVGTGSIDNARTKSQAFEKAKKEAVTDGLKRALRNFGNVVGNCVYDKTFCNAITKVKVTPTSVDMSNLHRRPEYDTSNTSTSSTASSSRTAQQLPHQQSNTSATHNRSNILPQRQNSSVQDTTRNPQPAPAPPSRPAPPAQCASPSVSVSSVKSESKPLERTDSFSDFDDFLNTVDPDVGPPVFHEGASVVSVFEPVGHSTIVSPVVPPGPAVPKDNLSSSSASKSPPGKESKYAPLTAKQKAARDAMIMSACSADDQPAPAQRTPAHSENMQPTGAPKRTSDGQPKAQESRQPLAPVQGDVSNAAKRARF